MADKAKIRINLTTREIELEGEETFIEKYTDIINDYLEVIKHPLSHNITVASEDEIQISNVPNVSPSSMPDSFGEYYSRFPKSMKDVDKILVAGYFIQQKTGNTFSSSEASSLLIEQGVKLSNAAAFLKANLESRKIFKHDGKFRLSELGVEYLRKLS